MRIKKTIQGNISFLSISGLNIYDDISDKYYLKQVIKNLFSPSAEMFLFFSREENLTDDAELRTLRTRIFQYLGDHGQLIYLKKVDQQRFDAIATINCNTDTDDFIIDCWKYFYWCSFFKPINNLTFDEYQDYLEVNGADNFSDTRNIMDKLCDFECTKGLGGGYLTISYNSELRLEEIIVNR